MSKSNLLRVKIYGARGSYSSTDNKATEVGVNTTCLRVDVGKNIIIFDAGSGIINCGKDLAKEFHTERSSQNKWKTHLFFTHMHMDHLCGFPFFAMLYMPKSLIHLISPRILDVTLEEALNRFMHPPLFPVGINDLPFEGHFHEFAEKYIAYFYEDDFKIKLAINAAEDGWLAKISCIRNYMHPKGGSFFYKIETPAGHKFVFASDTEGFVGGDHRLINFAKDADVLLHDAQYIPEQYPMFQGFGHSTYEMACEVAEKAGVKKLVLVHHDPNHDDSVLKEIEQNAAKIFPNTVLGCEGMEFEFD